MFFFLTIVAAFLFILTRIAQFFRRNRARFPQASYLLWWKSYKLFLIICLATIGYLLASIQLLASFR